LSPDSRIRLISKVPCCQALNGSFASSALFKLLTSSSHAVNQDWLTASA